MEDSVILQMEAAGRIEQLPDPNDKRKMLVYPTIPEDISEQKYIPWDRGEGSGNGKSGDKTDDEAEKKVAQAIVESVEKAMIDIEGNNKGYFFYDEFLLKMALTPNLNMDFNHIRQAFDKLLHEGKVEDTGEKSGQYRPTQKLSGTTGVGGV